MASKQKAHDARHENASFELHSSPGIGSLKKLFGGFCGDRMVAMDASERSGIRNRNRTTSEDVVRDLSKVLEGNIMSAEKQPPGHEQVTAIHTKKEGVKCTRKDRNEIQDNTETMADHNSVPQKEVPPVVEPVALLQFIDNRWMRTLEATIVTFLSVTVTFLIIQYMVGNVGISLNKRDAYIGEMQILPAFEKKVVDGAQKLMVNNKLVEGNRCDP